MSLLALPVQLHGPADVNNHMALNLHLAREASHDKVLQAGKAT